ncbi:MAG: hypothetical protein C9355_00600 [Thalassolituus maritimus]|uniref:DUF6916 domain-containing protein n=1 Tax=Thalassolituus maritimus TaxID=484498 RepID=A0A1N7KB62_9GAMM|nr:hypothetical protein [Thalassolituus maritimus]MEC8907908.1 hypothetical protein [Pseudomonadota bacterium]MEC9254621.1 hypothetical protein [Pseudomonadota bacterium]MEC9410969.1 hypothetical protein [Pseudomonadota bacterium]MEE3160500.1 hypothetical protein [Pseudomonadota bacterium]MEE3189326.1 hypothetical protein [Pseudomonadota bacterium]|tara:strand:+ start:246 stop:530 length:285 start_codon:yes stop_codon:yes gene_type:complete
MEAITYDSMESLLGQQVTLSDQADNSVRLTISEVERTALDGDDWEAFAVSLEGQDDFRVPQGMYRLTHEAIGSGELFITAHGPTEYQAVISRKR